MIGRIAPSRYNIASYILLTIWGKKLIKAIYLLSICSDSTPPVEEAAKKTKTELNSISISQCREEIAEATIQQAKHIG